MKAPADENSSRLFDHHHRRRIPTREENGYSLVIRILENSNLRLRFTETRDTRQSKAEMITVRQAETEKRRERLLLLRQVTTVQSQQRFFVLLLIRDIIISQKPDSTHRNDQTDKATVAEVSFCYSCNQS